MDHTDGAYRSTITSYAWLSPVPARVTRSVTGGSSRIGGYVLSDAHGWRRRLPERCQARGGAVPGAAPGDRVVRGGWVTRCRAARARSRSTATAAASSAAPAAIRVICQPDMPPVATVWTMTGTGGPGLGGGGTASAAGEAAARAGRMPPSPARTARQRWMPFITGLLRCGLSQ